LTTALSPGQYVLASVSSTIATRTEPSTSASVNNRPLINGTPIVSKKARQDVTSVGSGVVRIGRGGADRL
jgi:hypothetical protein